MAESEAFFFVTYKYEACYVAGFVTFSMTIQPTDPRSRLHARTTYSTALSCSWIGGDRSANYCVKRHYAICYAWFQTFALLSMLYSVFWVIPRRLNFMCLRFETLRVFYRLRRCKECEIIWVIIREKFVSKIASTIRKGFYGEGTGQSIEIVCGGKDPMCRPVVCL